MARPTPQNFPLSGLNEDAGFDVQPGLTTTLITNCRPHDTITERLRGGSRPGMNKFHADRISGNSPIQNMLKVIQARSFPTPSGNNVIVSNSTAFESQLSNLANDGTARYDTNPNDQNILGVAFDGEFYYVIGSQVTDANVDSNGPNQVFKLNSTGSTYSDTVEWFWAGSQTNAQGWSLAYDADNDRLYVGWTIENDFDGNSGVNASVAELDTSDGTLLWAQDLGSYTTQLALSPDGSFLYAACNTPNTLWTGAGGQTKSLFKIDVSDGSITQTFNAGGSTGSNLANLDVLSDGSVLLSIAIDNTAWDGAGGDSRNVWKFDEDLTVTTSYQIEGGAAVGDGVAAKWIETSGEFIVNYIDNTTPTNSTIQRYNAAGVSQWSFSPGAAGAAFAINGDNNVVVSVPTNAAWTGQTGDANFFILNGSTGAVITNVDSQDTEDLQVRFDIATLATASTDPLITRNTALIIVSKGDVKKLAANTLTTPTDGTGAMTIDQYVISMTELFSDVFMIDGTNAKYYDLATDAVKDWATDVTDGTLPSLPRLLARYRGRAVLSGVVADPHNWFMSKVGDPFDFDYSPATTTAIQAVAGNASEVGLVGDVVTALMPFNDDAMLIGCDSTLWQMSGDPAAGGSIDLVSEDTGVAWNAWTQDPNGAIWFLGVDGVYRIFPGERPVKMTANRLDRRFRAVDLSANRAMMAWDFLRQGLMLVITGVGSGSVATSFFYDERADAWVDETFPAAIGPSFMYGYDAEDPDDVEFLLGSKDGYIRKFDETESDDDGTAFTSTVRFPPIAVTDGNTEGIITFLNAVLAQNSGAVTMNVYTGQTAEQCAAATTPKFARTLGQGNSAFGTGRIRGRYVQIELTSTARWAFENLNFTIEPSGQRGRHLR